MSILAEIKEILKEGGIDGRKASSLAKKIEKAIGAVPAVKSTNSIIPRDKNAYIHKIKGKKLGMKNVTSSESLSENKV